MTRVVIVGGGFAGLYAAKVLGGHGVPLTLIDRRNFHLFQPLLYQVATGGLSPGDIAYPLRAVLRHHRNTRILRSEVEDIRPDDRRVVLSDDEIPYSHLIVATGVRHHYFGHGDWEDYAGGIKTVEDALAMRGRIFNAFESAEMAKSDEERRRLLTFVVVGGGPTGVELAGALAELAYRTLRLDFRAIDPTTTTIHLLEADARLLPPFPESLSRRAQRSLERLGVTVRTNTRVEAVDAEGVEVSTPGGKSERIDCGTTLWAAGVKTTGFGERLVERTGADADRAGRIRVEPELHLERYPDIFVLGDLARVEDENGEPLPGLAPVAMQQGRYAAMRIMGRARGPFRYRDKGQLAVIGRNTAVAELGGARFGGFFAWLLWILVHIRYLIVFNNRVVVMTQWALNYVTRNRGARLITAEAASTEKDSP